jgi:hypothetical protein
MMGDAGKLTCWARWKEDVFGETGDGGAVSENGSRAAALRGDIGGAGKEPGLITS